VIAVLAFAFVLLVSDRSSAEVPIREGMRLAEALSLLQAEGLLIVYSSALVRSDLVIERPPTAHDPRAILDQILKPLGFAVRQGPGEQLVIVEAPGAEPRPAAGRIEGVVTMDSSRRKLPQVAVRVIGTGLSADVGDDGLFRIPAVPPGEYSVEFESVAFLPQRIEGVRVQPGKTATVRAHLVPATAFLGEIVVAPTQGDLLGEETEVRQSLSPEDISRMPHLADDVFRAAASLPGTAGSDYSALFNVRGGAANETLVILDGLELYEPFHLKDFQNVFSTVNAAAVGGMDLMTGGYPAQYGDRMGAVMEIPALIPSGATSYRFGVGTINADLYSEGALDQNGGRYLVSGRGWYPGALLDTSGSTSEEVLTEFYDVLARVEHPLTSRSTLAANALLASDNLAFTKADVDEVERVRARYRSSQLWLNLRTAWTPALSSQTVLSASHGRRVRTGEVDDAAWGSLDVTDNRSFSSIGLKQDWTWDATRHHRFKWGIDARSEQAEYDYSRTEMLVATAVTGGGQPRQEEIAVDISPQGTSLGLFVADRFRLSERAVAEVGLRWDKQTWAGGRQISPRVNLRYAAGSWTVLRASWGHFYQSQRLNELQVEDGVSEFWPAQRAVHTAVSLEQRLPPGVVLRLEAYEKNYDKVSPHYENLFNPIEVLPETRDDRILVAPQGGRARGIELAVLQDQGKSIRWRASYALARAEDAIGGEDVPRSWDQRHAVGLGLDLRLPRDWSLNLAGTYHSGWPTTAVTGRIVGWDEDEPIVELVPGPRNGERLPAYLRLDLRAGKSWPTRHGLVTAIVDIVNLTNRKNVCCATDFTPVVGQDGTVEVIREDDYWAPIFPSVAVRWQF
jgi:outer membrane cobalamin receptor